VRASRSYTVLDIDGMKYGMMDAPVAEMILINRKHLTPFAGPPSSSPSGAD
jgi:hypothetical protein